ncbi:hypothetical protein BIZ83_gp190 [Erwinia phage vB_EamM_ChrisDB]|uniref:hypothetical protein n=1 Tax=Erwinia phage vB_EamM_ChrisDB TaxID=1883371 RepID=UPI00081D0A7A|nr:hypothetical protein BIZ83_gp190 [Erwinia phage vB_EamM_ChrisDB]ANZ48663.1 hypothetical protein CHRISDB_101 [Erwinia phage vB_EamM_ChrisDB]
MKPQLRVRTLLIPALAVLRSISDLEKRKFKKTERQLMVKVVLEELMYTYYDTVPWDYSYDAPPFQGMAFVKLKEAIPFVPDDDLKGIIARLKAACHTLLLPYTLIGRFDSKDGESVPSFARRLPQIFDHGVSFSWHNDFLQARWVRPTVDYKEMSVFTYFHTVHAHYVKRAKGVDEAMLAGGLIRIPMSKFLTSEYEVVFS